MVLYRIYRRCAKLIVQDSRQTQLAESVPVQLAKRDRVLWLLQALFWSDTELLAFLQGQKMEEFTSSLSNLISKYGDAESRHCHNIAANGAVLESSYHLYKARKSEITASDWVGQISAYLEMWEMNRGRPALRGSRIVLEAEVQEEIKILLGEDRNKAWEWIADWTMAACASIQLSYTLFIR
ncbi:hypothetical protein IFM46972_10500 [Aspergillus udagawae]|uniref:Uncharacterized protein n=1 Tax=Aspergillus udagawae TaxID=91492 RepID=A0A8H3SCX3_9EURO|nr:hypothetical protein IFM46972_10500 [Aspergillus udagawae]